MNSGFLQNRHGFHEQDLILVEVWSPEKCTKDFDLIFELKENKGIDRLC